MNSSKTAVWVGILTAAAVVAAACIQRHDIVPSLTPVAPSPSVHHTLLFFTEDNCPWCDKEHEAMKTADLSAFAVSEVKDSLRAFSWRVRAYPTLIITDAGGRELGRHEGYLAPDALDAWLKGYK